jgi:DNA replicative helicase MCM subunit Mcm2 (Cdc46/Mcm family)
VSVEDVQECLDLIEESQASVQTDKDAKPKKQDSTSVIFDIIKSMCKYNENCQADYELVEKRVLARGFTQDQFETTLKSYESNNVLMHLNNRIMIVSG